MNNEVISFMCQIGGWSLFGAILSAIGSYTNALALFSMLTVISITYLTLIILSQNFSRKKKNNE